VSRSRTSNERAPASSPRLYVVSAPSGGGKTSLVNALLERDPRVALSVSHTTRAPRPGEQDGVHYSFVDDAAFESLAGDHASLVHAHDFDHRYGTGRESDVLLDIDWQGARQIRASFPAARTIFILPPSLEELRRRLVGRGQDSEAVIERRMQAARTELSHAGEFDFLIVNDDFERALADLHAVIRHGAPLRDTDQAAGREILAQLLETG